MKERCGYKGIEVRGVIDGKPRIVHICHNPDIKGSYCETAIKRRDCTMEQERRTERSELA